MAVKQSDKLCNSVHATDKKPSSGADKVANVEFVDGEGWNGAKAMSRSFRGSAVKTLKLASDVLLLLLVLPEAEYSTVRCQNIWGWAGGRCGKLCT